MFLFAVSDGGVAELIADGMWIFRPILGSYAQHVFFFCIFVGKNI